MEKALVKIFATIVTSSIRHLQEPELLSSSGTAPDSVLHSFEYKADTATEIQPHLFNSDSHIVTREPFSLVSNIFFNQVTIEIVLTFTV